MPAVVIAVVVAAVAPPVKSSSATNGAAAGPPAEMSTPELAADAVLPGVVPAVNAVIASSPATMAKAATRTPANRNPDRWCLLTWEERLMAAPAGSGRRQGLIQALFQTVT